MGSAFGDVQLDVALVAVIAELSRVVLYLFSGPPTTTSFLNIC